MQIGYPGGGEGVLYYFHIIRVYEGMDTFGRFKIEFNFCIWFIILIYFFIIFIIIIKFFFFWGGGGGVIKFNFYGEGRFCGYFFWGSFLCIYRGFLKFKVQNSNTG